MRVFINRKPYYGAFGGGAKFVNAFYEHAPEFGIEICNKLNQSYDAIFIMDIRPDDELKIGLDEIQRYRLFKPGVKIFQRTNECDARKNTNDMDKMLLVASEINDYTFFVSNWMKDYHVKRGWKCESSSVIYNGIDRSIFKPNTKFGNGKINIACHHWSDNRMKGADVYEWLDKFVAKYPDEFSFTYIGRTQANLPHSKIIAPLYGKELGDELGKYDVYINGTVCDPAPNSTIEAISCGIPTYCHARGGGTVELVDDKHVFKNEAELEALLLSKKFEKNETIFTDWKTCIKSYFDKMKEICDVKP